MAGLTDTGFTRKTLPEILDSLKQRAKDEFGTDFNTADDSVFTQLAGVFALECDEAWQGLEGAYSAYTLNGAEGVFLDDMFSRHNIIRLDATAGSGVAYIESDNTTVLPQGVTQANNTVFSASNNISYDLSVDKVIDIDASAAYKIISSDILIATTYTIFCEDDLGAIQDTEIIVTLDTDKAAFVTAVKAFVDATNTSTSGKTFDFTTVGSEEFYLGFDSNKGLDPLASEITFYTSPAIGNRFSSVSLIASEIGHNPLPSKGIKDMTPKFTGFISAANVVAFASGTAVETDAEFRARFNRIIDASATGCDRASIETAISNLTGVASVRIYENPTDTPTAEVDTAYAFNTVVSGGVADDIAQTLFDNGPINVLTAGTTTINKTTTDGTIIPVKFSVAISADLSLRITYSTILNTDFTEFEEQSIKDEIAVLSLNFGVGTTVYNAQLNGAIVSSINYGRLSGTLVAETKLVSEGAGSYTTADFVPAFDEFPQIAEVDITFVRV
jgi:uncharacterized phage protein gp47/JayE